MAILISQETLRELAGDSNQVCLPEGSILTPSAKDFAMKAGLTVTRGGVEVMAPSANKASFKRTANNEKLVTEAAKEICTAPPTDICVKSMVMEAVQKVMGNMAKSGCENHQVTHIAGDEVVIEPFAKAPAGQNIKMTDVITAREANLAAGFMIFEKSNLPWTLTYDEIDYVVEGDFELRVGNKVFKGKPGDVISIPKGTSVVFGSPSRAKVFYVTYPANWEEMSN